MRHQFEGEDFELDDERAYDKAPRRWCDLVMKGGVTSAIVYPKAFCEIAREFRIKNIGGTSAGAIAAAGAAAAESHRQRLGSAAGFTRAAKIPDDVSAEKFVLNLFRSQEPTAPIFDIFTTFTDNSTKLSSRIKAAVGIAFSAFKPMATRAAILVACPCLLALLLAISLGFFSGFDAASLGRVAIVALVLCFVALLVSWRFKLVATRTVALAALSCFIAIAFAAALGVFSDFDLVSARTGVAILLSVFLLAVLLFLAGLAAFLMMFLGLYQRVMHAIPENFYGITTGFGEPYEGVKRLTVWLADLLDELAGLPGQEQPLTFGDLWGLDRTQRASDRSAYDEQAERLRLNSGARAVNLEIMTTCITLGRPYKFPHLPRTFFFHPDQFRELFPERVVKWMVDHQGSVGERLKPVLARSGYVPMPDAADLPVVVAMRMSVSTPPLVSAIPLGALDYRVPADRREVEPVWFSDGGITSNFPVHFFDSPLPRWPTMAINLKPFGLGEAPDPTDQTKNLKIAVDNGQGVLEFWQRIGVQKDGTYKGSLGGFFGAILSTMQGWTDNLQALQPGYRDRIVHVLQDSTEGGSNLRSAETFVKPLSERGRAAGARLRRRFGPNGDGTVMTWDNHRWARYRRTMASLQAFAESYSVGYNEPHGDDRPYSVLIEEGSHEGVEPSSFRMGVAQEEFAKEATDEFVDLAQSWRQARDSFRNGDGVSFDERAPNPKNLLRMTPPQDQSQFPSRTSRSSDDEDPEQDD